MTGHCVECDRPVSTRSTERCRSCNGRLMRERHRLWRIKRAQALGAVAKRARAVVRRMDSIDSTGGLHV
jgi:DNA-directed RNA polymerase subunit RPC12/RpoP